MRPPRTAYSGVLVFDVSPVCASGWIFDVYPEPGGMALWLVGDMGENHKFHVPFAPSFYLDAAPEGLLRYLARIGVPTKIKESCRRHLDSGDEILVVEVKVDEPPLYAGVIASLQERFQERDFFTCDIEVESLFFYETGLFPLARIEIEADTDGRLIAWEARDDPWSTEYALPPLTVMELGTEGTPVHPKQLSSKGALSVCIEEREYVIEPGSEACELTRIIEHYDPHVILTEWGDDYLIAALSRLPGFGRIPFHRGGGGAHSARPGAKLLHLWQGGLQRALLFFPWKVALGPAKLVCHARVGSGRPFRARPPE